MVLNLPVESFATDREGVAPKCVTDGIITDAQEKDLSELGFIPLCHCPDTELSAFYSSQSLQKPKKYDEPAATTNAKLSAMLQYILCTARFAHYLKVLARDKVGSFRGPAEVEEFLQRWILNYTSSIDEAGLETKAKYPLREARVQIKENLAKPGKYNCVIHLQPHFQLDQVITAVRLATELAPTKVH
jgi:type VI secretion system ImpC/EvpB family protein